MKLIGKTEHGFIAEVSELELLNLVGCWSHNDRDAPRSFRVGTVVDITDMFRRGNEVKRVIHDLAGSVKTLRACADLIEQPIQIARQPNEAKPESST